MDYDTDEKSGTIFAELERIIIDAKDRSTQIICGNIPEKLFLIPKHNFTGNQLNCGNNFSNPCTLENTDRPRKSRTVIIVGAVISIFVVLLVSCFLLVFYFIARHRGYRSEVFVDVTGEVDQRIEFGQLKRFSWRELLLATDNFSEANVLGQGGFGKVYKGVIADNTKVAVKLLIDFKNRGVDTAFQREVEMISVTIQRNLLRLIGFCTTPTERLLVYPFMQNLSVASKLRGLKPGEPALNWSTRKKVALGTARGAL